MDSNHPFFDLEKQLADVNNSIRAAVDRLSAAFATGMEEALEGLHAPMRAVIEALAKLPDELRTVTEVLADRGWFISAEMELPLLRAIQAGADSGDLEHVDELMDSWLSSQTHYIEARAIDHFPNRAPIIAAAMRAHETGMFELSIPVLLIQIEGMCIQELGTKLYSTKKGLPATKELVESLIDGPIMDIFLLPLRRPSGLTAGAEHRPDYPHALNRHEIAHGVSTDYPSRRNSLKAISLMEYFVSIVVSEKRTAGQGPSST